MRSLYLVFGKCIIEYLFLNRDVFNFNTNFQTVIHRNEINV